MTPPVHVLSRPHSVLQAHVAVPADLEADEQERPIEEHPVALPVTRVVVRF